MESFGQEASQSNMAIKEWHSELFQKEPTVARYGSRAVSKIPQTIPAAIVSRAHPINAVSRNNRSLSFFRDVRFRPEKMQM